MGWIYMIKNKINGKAYIGQTICEKVSTRWCDHKRRPKGCLKGAFNKHGINNFEFSTIHEIPERPGWREELDSREILEIFTRNTLAPYGYNIETGGNKRKIVSVETREKISESRKGAGHPFFGRKYTDDEKKHLSEMNKGKSQAVTTISKKFKKIDKFTLDGEFIETYESIKQAAVEGIQQSSISRCCNEKLKTAGGFVWKFSLL
jgi:group I intron endonuclease